MLPLISIDSESQEVTDDVEYVTVEFDTDREETHRCRACSEPLTQDGEVFSGGPEGALCLENLLDGPVTDDSVDYGPHDPEPIPLSWVNSAAIHLDEREDSVTVMISVGDPRGAFAFTVRRIPSDTDAEHAGRLIMHMPHPGESSPHVTTKELHAGTLLIGD
jgi:hypothetical protein